MAWNREGTVCTCKTGERYYRHPGSGGMALLGAPDPAPRLETLRPFHHAGPELEKPAKAPRSPKARDPLTLDMFDDGNSDGR